MRTDSTGDFNSQKGGSIFGTIGEVIVGLVIGVVAGAVTLVLMFMQLAPLCSLAFAFMIGWAAFVPMVAVAIGWAVYLFRVWDSLPTESLFDVDTADKVKRRKWVILGTVGQVLLCVAIVMGAIHKNDAETEEMRQRFDERIADIRQDWDALFTEYPGGGSSAAPSPLQGVMIVNMESREWEPLMTAVNEKMLATTRSELKHLIRVRRWNKQVGTTESGRVIERKVCHLEIVDFPERRLVFKTTIEGSIPNTYRRRRTVRVGTGSDPLWDWLTSTGAITR
jgi:hypothetical protein